MERKILAVLSATAMAASLFSMVSVSADVEYKEEATDITSVIVNATVTGGDALFTTQYINDWATKSVTMTEGTDDYNLSPDEAMEGFTNLGYVVSATATNDRGEPDLLEDGITVTINSLTVNDYVFSGEDINVDLTGENNGLMNEWYGDAGHDIISDDGTAKITFASDGLTLNEAAEETTDDSSSDVETSPDAPVLTQFGVQGYEQDATTWAWNSLSDNFDEAGAIALTYNYTDLTKDLDLTTVDLSSAGIQFFYDDEGLTEDNIVDANIAYTVVDAAGNRLMSDILAYHKEWDKNARNWAVADETAPGAYGAFVDNGTINFADATWQSLLAYGDITVTAIITDAKIDIVEKVEETPDETEYELPQTIDTSAIEYSDWGEQGTVESKYFKNISPDTPMDVTLDVTLMDGYAYYLLGPSDYSDWSWSNIYSEDPDGAEWKLNSISGLPLKSAMTADELAAQETDVGTPILQNDGYIILYPSGGNNQTFTYTLSAGVVAKLLENADEEGEGGLMHQSYGVKVNSVTVAEHVEIEEPDDSSSTTDDSSVADDSSAVDDSSVADDSSAIDDSSATDSSSAANDSSTTDDSSTIDDSSVADDSSSVADSSSAADDSSSVADSSSATDDSSSVADSSSTSDSSSKPDTSSTPDDSSKPDDSSQTEPPAIVGDTNNDGTVEIKDVIRLQKYINDKNTEITAADINGDGEINIKDVIRLQKMLNEA